MRNKFFWSISGNLSNCFIQLFILTYLTYQQGLVSAGIFALAWAIVSPIFNFVGLQIRGVIATDTSKAYSLTQYRQFIHINNAFGLLVILSIAYFFADTFSVFACILVLGLSKAIENLADIDYGLYQKLNRQGYSGQSLFIKNVLLIVCLILLIPIQIDYLSMSLLYLVSRLILIVFNRYRLYTAAYLKITESDQFSFQLNIWLAFLKQVYPMGIVVLVVALSQSLPRIFLDVYFDKQAVAIFSNCLTFFLVVVALTNAIGQMHMARLAKYFYAQKFNCFLKVFFIMLIQVIFLLVSVQIVVVLFGVQIIELLIGSKQDQYFLFFEILFIATAFQCLSFVMDYSLTAIRKFKFLAIKQVISFIVFVPVLVVMINFYGVIGSAYALLIIAMLQFSLASVLLIWFWGGALMLHGREKYPFINEQFIYKWIARAQYLKRSLLIK